MSDRVRHSASQVVFEEHDVIGFNYRMTDIQAAVGREQLRRLPSIISRRREIGATYTQRLATIDGVGVPVEPAGVRTNWQSYTVELPPWCDQREVMQSMLDLGVATRRGIMCSHREEPYRHAGRQLPESERAQDRFIILPLFPQMGDDDLEQVCTALRTAVAR